MDSVKIIYKDSAEDSEYRCPGCNRLLLKGTLRDGILNTKCPRCNKMIQLLEANKEGYYVANSDIQEIIKVSRSAFDHSSEHIVITNGDGIIFYANKAAEKITGFKVKEMIGKKAGSRELWGGHMDEKYYQKLWKTITIDKESFISEIKNRMKNGEYYDAEINISPLLSSSDEIVGFVAIERPIIDVSSTLLPEEQIGMVHFRESSDQIRNILSTLIFASSIDFNDPNIEKSSTSKPNDVINDLLAEFSNFVDTRKLDMHIAMPESLKSIKVSKQLLTHLFRPLIREIVQTCEIDSEVNIVGVVTGKTLSIMLKYRKVPQDGAFASHNLFNFRIAQKIAQHIGGLIKETESEDGIDFLVELPVK